MDFVPRGWKLFCDNAGKAERGYLQALKEARKPTPIQSKILDLDDVKVNLAEAYLIQEKYDESEKFLRSVIDGSATTDGPTVEDYQK